MRIESLKYLAVLSALILYGLFGQPTPDNVGMIEIIIALLLLLGAGVHGLSAFLVRSADRAQNNQALWFTSGQFFALWGFTIPLAVALFSANNLIEVVRDLIAFGFLILPLLYAHLFRDARGFRRLFMAGVVFIGVAFSARIFLPLFFPALGLPDAVALYLTITPAVLFAALYLLAASFLRISWRRGNVLYNVAYGVYTAGFALLPIFAIAFALQRASVAAVIVFGVLGVFYIMLYRPETVLRLIVVLAAFLMLSAPYLYDVLLRLELKHIQVGFNSRSEELHAVLALGSENIWRFLFGHGWGALFENPAVGNMPVGYTHNLFSYYFFKTGFIGVLCLGFYWLSVLRENIRIIRINLPLGLSLLLPLLISTFFYASHKAFSFGLLFLLVCAITRRQSVPSASNQGSAVEQDTDIVYSNNA